MNIKIQRFAEMVEREQIARLVKEGLDCKSNVDDCKVKVIDGNKYVKVNIGTGGRFMIESATETIFGIKAYGQVHRGHVYGTLDTIDEWNWGNYYPSRCSEKNIPENLPKPAPKEKEVVVPVVGMGVTEGVGSDRYPYEVIAVIDERHVDIRELDAICIANGGQENQEWRLTSNESNQVKHLWKNKKERWVEKGGSKCKYYWIGHARKYSDPYF